jgi:hypothetical protein
MRSKPDFNRSAGACLLAVAALLFCSWAFAASGARAAGFEGSNSLSELSQQAESSEGEGSSSETSTSTTGAEKESTSSTGKSTIFIGAGAALLLLLGIAYVIVKDARRVAPAGVSDDFQDGPRGRDRAVEMRNRRAKAKAARNQRKKNR